MCQNGRSPDTDRSDTSQDSPERIHERLQQISQTGLIRINERTNCSQTGQVSPETFIERLLSLALWLAAAAGARAVY